MKRLALVLAVAAALGACSRQEDSASTAASSVTPAPSSTTPAPSAPAADTTVAANTTSTSPAPSSTSPDAGSTAAMGAAGSGQDTYGKACVVCHGAGVAGAPKLGDKGDWGPRIAQGNDTLYKHALEGYTGKKGMMPPKGGNTALADADVKAAVDYMVAQGK
jgi:cytochrome c5